MRQWISLETVRFGRRFFKFLICLFPLLPASLPAWEAETEEEVLCLRRIAEFWAEGDYQLVKEQIIEFLQEYPDSALSQTLRATLGDVYLREKNFKDALMHYSHISDPAIARRVFFNRMHCLHELRWLSTLADECETALTANDLDPNDRLQTTHLLAATLYQQILATSEAASLTALATRAYPYVQSLYQREYSNELAFAFAHICKILNELKTGSTVYVDLAEKNPESREEWLFQAATLQAQYDKPLAIQTFYKIAEMKQERFRDALYNCLILTFQCGNYELLIGQKESWLANIPKGHVELAHLFFGRSYLELNRPTEALGELLLFIETAAPSEELRSALVDVLDLSFKLEREPLYSKALQRFSDVYPEDPQLPKGMLGRALLLKKGQKLQDARQELKIAFERFPQSPEREPILFEYLQLEFHENLWSNCREHCAVYLELFPTADHSPFVWRFFVSSSFQLAKQDPSANVQFAADLQSMLKVSILSPSEELEWTFVLAKTLVDLKHYEQAADLFTRLIEQTSDFPGRADSYFLLGLCYREGKQDLAKFCHYAELALPLNPTLLDKPSMHLALFNGYLALDSLDLAAEHLFEASKGLWIQSDHLLWLAEVYYQKFNLNADLASAEKALSIIERFITQTHLNIHALDQTALPREPLLVQLAELRGALGKSDEQFALLKSLKRQQEANSAWAWKEESKIDLLLADQFAKRGNVQAAIGLLDRIVSKHPTLRSLISASAALQGARLRLAQKISGAESGKILTLLKTLVLQRTLANEPIHLEAAIEYIDLHMQLSDAPQSAEQRLALLLKTKADFETVSDVLSRDYHNARATLPEKEHIYQLYMAFFNAEILVCRAALTSSQTEREQLLAQAKKIYRDLVNTSTSPFLHKKASLQLEALNQ